MLKLSKYANVLLKAVDSVNSENNTLQNFLGLSFLKSDLKKVRLKKKYIIYIFRLNGILIEMSTFFAVPRNKRYKW